jgi:hypothetical protein
MGLKKKALRVVEIALLPVYGRPRIDRVPGAGDIATRSSMTSAQSSAGSALASFANVAQSIDDGAAVGPRSAASGARARVDALVLRDGALAFGRLPAR